MVENGKGTSYRGVGPAGELDAAYESRY